jgi:hypothetical protein
MSSGYSDTVRVLIELVVMCCDVLCCCVAAGWAKFGQFGGAAGAEEIFREPHLLSRLDRVLGACMLCRFFLGLCVSFPYSLVINVVLLCCAAVLCCDVMCCADERVGERVLRVVCGSRHTALLTSEGRVITM